MPSTRSPSLHMKCNDHHYCEDSFCRAIELAIARERKRSFDTMRRESSSSTTRPATELTAAKMAAQKRSKSAVS
jgi:hypothetical protein